jgi:hypothetical protein
MDTSLASGMYYLPYALNVNLAFLGEFTQESEVTICKTSEVQRLMSVICTWHGKSRALR